MSYRSRCVSRSSFHVPYLGSSEKLADGSGVDLGIEMTLHLTPQLVAHYICM